MRLGDRKKLGSIKSLTPVRGVGSKRSPGPTTRLNAERERDFVLISQELLKGTSYQSIAEKLKEGRTYPVSRDTVYRDAKVILGRWRELAMESIDEHKAKQLARLADMELRCMESLDRLQNGTTMSTDTAVKTIPAKQKDGQDVLHTATRRAMLQDTTSAWLSTWRFIQEQRARILGLNAAVKIDSNVPLHIGDNNTAVQMVVNITGGDGATKRYDFPIHELPDDHARTEPEPP